MGKGGISGEFKKERVINGRFFKILLRTEAVV